MRLKLGKDELEAVRQLADASDAANGGPGDRYPIGFIKTSWVDTAPL